MLTLSIKIKVILVSVFGLFLMAIILGAFSVNEIKQVLIKNSFERLDSARESKINQVHTFFEKIAVDIEVLSKSENVINLVTELDTLKNDISINKKAAFPIENERVKSITSHHEKYFQEYMKKYGYYDIFLIDAKDGHVLYTAAKESDYGSNLYYGPLKDSPLAEVLSKTLENNRTTFIDMKPYSPSNNQPAMFVGTPITYEGDVSSILVFQISDKQLNSIMDFRVGYGKTQEVYLVGKDYLMRSDSYLDIKHHSVAASFANPLSGQIKSKAVLNSFKGETHSEIIKDYKGESVLSSYRGLKIGEDLLWAIVAEIKETEVMMEPNYIRNIIVLVSLALLLLISFLAYFVIMHNVIKPLKKFQEGLLSFFSYLNKEKKDVTLLEHKNEDEIGIMVKAVNVNIISTKENIEKDQKLITEAQEVMSLVKKGSYSRLIEGSSSNESLENFKNDVNDSIEKTKVNFENINLLLEEYSQYNYLKDLDIQGLEKGEAFDLVVLGINKLQVAITEMLVENKSDGVMLQGSASTLLLNVDVLNTSSSEAAASLEETAAALEEMTAAIVSNTDTISDMSKYANDLNSAAAEGQKLANETMNSMDEINEQVSQINNAISIIDQISFQTNILSLNAAVEAATAGEAGKGFAVVAQEVRNLASRSADAAKEIKTIVENANNKAMDGKKIAQSMMTGYSSLNENISKTIELIKDVDSSSKEQQCGIEQINDAITQQDGQTQKIAQAAAQAHDVAEGTNSLANKIVQSADEKEFEGKNVASSSHTNSTQVSPVALRANKTDINYKGKEKRALENSLKHSIKNNKEYIENNKDKEWERF